MKPENAAHAADFTVRPIDLATARGLVIAYHYAKSASNTCVYAFGLFHSGALRGAAIWLPPTKPCALTVNPQQWRRVLSLSRLVIVPGEPTNAASILIGACIRAIRRAAKWVSLVTFADESQGHTGTIYRATNWTYVGKTRPEPRYVDRGGASSFASLYEDANEGTDA